MLESLIPVDELLNDHQLYHSEFQQDRFITIRSGGGTEYGCYKQALRELQKRVSAIREMEFQLEELEIDLEEIAEKLTVEAEGTVSYRRLMIQQSRKLLARESLEKSMAETRRELLRFHQQASALKESIGELTEERRRELDAEFWENKIKGMLAVEFAVHGNPSAETLELLQCLPPEMRVRLLKMVQTPESVKRLTTEFMEDQSPAIRIT